ncbi:MAG: hypothetical protein VX776_08720, partial [Planctomycetota bacterium]|nr:hypothetical protein [Planctomycetota bacterium]
SRLDWATDGEIMARYIPMTPAQLKESTLIPRYDLYQQAFGDTRSPLNRQIRGSIEAALNGFTTVWQKAVLLRPAWPMRVLIDEVARNAATIGAQASISGFIAGMNELQINWFRKHGIDIGKPIGDEIVGELLAAKRRARGVDASDELAAIGETSPGALLGERWDDWLEVAPWELTPDDFAELLQSYGEAERLGLVDPLTDLVERVIGAQYGLQRIRKRTALTTGLGLFLAGPIGAAIGAGYGLYGRSVMRRVARSEVVNNHMFILREAARGDLFREIQRTRDQIAKLDPDDLASAKALTQEIENLQTATRILETGAEVVSEHDKWLLDNLKETNAPLYDKFDQVGLLAAEGNYNNVYFGGYGVENAFGSNPADIAIYKNAISSDNSNRQIWEGASSAARRRTRQSDRSQYDVANPKHGDTFPAAYNDTVNRQWIPHGDRSGPFQTFMRMFWDGSSDEDILRFLQGDGVVVREAFPDTFEANPQALIADLRAETNTLIPDLPEFADLRRKAADGIEIQWERDVVPVLNRHFDGDVNKARTAAGTDDFGKVVGDSTLQDIAETRNMQSQVTEWVDKAFENIGTLPTDALTRSPLFRTIYEREVARQLGALKGPDGDVFTLTGNDIAKIEQRARTKAISKSKELLYDLAERTRFEEVVANIMPFVGAWQEVITQWTGIAIDNPQMVARAIRNWRLIDAEDEHGKALSIFRLPSIFGADIPFGGKLIPFADGKLFGKASVLADTAVNFNIKSVSMIGGAPGIGPLVSFPVSEIVIENPSFESAVDWILPYGVNEGDNALKRWFSSVAPAWSKAMAGGLGLDTPERGRTLARITADLAYEYESHGEIIETEADWIVFEEEVFRRTEKVLQIRALGAMSLPMSFRMQSPHWKMIEKYYEISKETGLEAADTWLLHNHPDLWVITGRQTAARGVASGTLQGEKAYRAHQDAADKWPELRDLYIGRTGPMDVRFEHSRAVAIKEKSEGRRVDLTPREIYENASLGKGWRTWNQVTSFINEQLQAAEAMGQSADINAHPKLLDLRNSAAVIYGKQNPVWYEEYMEPQNPFTQARIIQGLREFLIDPTFNYHPSWALIEKWVDNHDNTAVLMWERYMQSGDRSFLRLGDPKNGDLAATFHSNNLELSLRPDFVEIFNRYLAKVDTVKQSNFSWNFPKVGVLEQSEEV